MKGAHTGGGLRGWVARLFLSGEQRELFQRGLPIFVMHKVADPPARVQDPYDYITPNALEARLSGLVRAGYTPMTIEAVHQPRKEPGFVVTFDDGYQDVFLNGLEILGRHRVVSIQFLLADLLGKMNEWDAARGEAPEPLMDETQVREWLAAGQQIGSHGLDHSNLKRLTNVQAREQIFSSKKKLEDTFGIPIHHFCYPYGKVNQTVRDMVQEAGYQTACGVEFGVNPPSQDPFHLRRIQPRTFFETVGKAGNRLVKKLAIRARN